MGILCSRDRSVIRRVPSFPHLRLFCQVSVFSNSLDFSTNKVSYVLVSRVSQQKKSLLHSHAGSNTTFPRMPTEYQHITAAWEQAKPQQLQTVQSTRASPQYPFRPAGVSSPQAPKLIKYQSTTRDLFRNDTKTLPRPRIGSLARPRLSDT